jgi:hypothetical protein
MSSIRICLKFAEKVYKISSLYLSSDGSFKLDIPYAPYEKGFLTKITIDYSKNSSMVPVEQGFTSTNRPQLSVHASGFVQFSGPGIISGIDNETGKAKGLGVFSNPLKNPIRSGPTLGITFWGVTHFEELEIKRKNDIIIKDTQLINRVTEKKELNSFNFELFIFNENFSKYIRDTDEGEVATVSFPQYKHSPGAIFTFPIVRLLNHTSFIGILPFKVNTQFAEESSFGFNFGGPSGTEYPGGIGAISQLCALSEKHIFDSKNSLNYTPNT